MLSAILILLTALQTAPATAPVGRFPFIEVDAAHRKVRVACEALHCQAPLEFLCVVNATNEHESVLRTRARPAQLHAALLMIGLEAGQPVHVDPKDKQWHAPTGPELKITIEFTNKDGKVVTLGAEELMRDLATKKPMPARRWIFAGSRVMPDGAYGADVTGYVVSVVNFELTPIDVEEVASSANETLEWEANLDLLPALGSPVTMIIEPAGAAASTAPSSTTQP